MEEPEEKLIRIIIPDLLFPDAAAFLRAHGCTISVSANGDDTVTTVTLPQGTTGKLLYGRAASERHCIAMPDGTVIRQVYDPGTGNSALFIPAQRGKEERR